MSRRMSLCLFGDYDPLYPRNILVKKTLEETNIEIIECRDQSSGIKHYLNLIGKFISHGRKADKIYVAVLGYYDVPLAWILAKIFNKELIFDAFYSLYDTYIDDRKIAKPKTYKAFRFYFYDWISIRLADKVILDTKENINYFVKKYKVRRTKFFELPVTADPDIFKISPHKKHKVFTVGFYGSFMPLHGVDKIVDAMSILKDRKIKCLLQGIGPGIESIRSKINSLRLDHKIKLKEKKMSYNKLPNFFNNIDLFLAGPFGDSPKAKRILPAKAAEALSVGTPVVIARTRATYRLLKDYKGKIIWFKEKTPEQLAKVIIEFMQGEKRASIDYREADYFKSSTLSFNNFVKRLSNIVKN